VDLVPSNDQREIANQVASFLAKEVPLSRVREIARAPSSVDPTLWSELAEMGWFGIALAEEHGGSGFGLVEEMLLFREIGRYLTPGPILSTVIGAHLAVAAGANAVAGAITSGAAVVALGNDPEGALELGGPALSGSVAVLDGREADFVLVVAESTCTLVDRRSQDEADVRSLVCVDPAARLDVVGLRGAPVVGGPAVDLWSRGVVLSAAACCGIAEATRDMSATYATHRVQYGVPIGSFQAVKHRCADMAMRAEAAFTQTCFAALTLEAGRPDAAFQARAAKVIATDAAITNAADNVQNHGGIGFTEEHDAQLFVKRAYVYEHVFGDVRAHTRAIMRGPGLADPTAAEAVPRSIDGPSD
jgi:alkylation response protein AidB-like acyl-CoA dehydrogenase